MEHNELDDEFVNPGIDWAVEIPAWIGALIIMGGFATALYYFIDWLTA
jgi:hypothetical protein